MVSKALHSKENTMSQQRQREMALYRTSASGMPLITRNKKRKTENVGKIKKVNNKELLAKQKTDKDMATGELG